MPARCAPRGPECILQALRQRDEALTAEHDMGVLEPGTRQAEVVQPMIELLTGHGDPQLGHVGKVREPRGAGLVYLAEDHILIGAVHGPPGANPARCDRRLPYRSPPSQLRWQGYRFVENSCKASLGDR